MDILIAIVIVLLAVYFIHDVMWVLAIAAAVAFVVYIMRASGSRRL